MNKYHRAYRYAVILIIFFLVLFILQNIHIIEFSQLIPTQLRMFWSNTPWKEYNEKRLGFRISAPSHFNVIMTEKKPFLEHWERKIIISDMKLTESNVPTSDNILVEAQAVIGGGDPVIYKGIYIVIELNLITDSQSITSRKTFRKIHSIDDAEAFKASYNFKKDGYSSTYTSIDLIKNGRVYEIHASYPNSKKYETIFNSMLSTIKFVDSATEKALNSDVFYPVSIKAENAYLIAKDLSIVNNGQLVHVPKKLKDLHVPLSDEYAEIDATWDDESAEQRLYISFEKNNSVWSVKELRIWDTFGEWIRFEGFDGASLGKEINGKEMKLVSKDGRTTIRLLDYHIQPFTRVLPPVEKSGYRLVHNVENGVIKLFYNPKHDGAYITSALLYDAAGKIVKDQRSITYKWIMSDSTVISLTSDGDVCPATKFISPCPNYRATFDGSKLGKTTVTAKAIDIRSSETLASTSFDVIIVTKEELVTK